MRQGEILKLTWDKVDLERNFIRLAGTDTKTGFKRRIPIHPRVREMLINLPRGLHTNRVFLSKGKPVNNFAGNLLICRVLKRNYCSGSYVFNRCSVQISLLPSKRMPLFKRASWASSLIYALFYEGALFIKGILGNMIMIGIGQ